MKLNRFQCDRCGKTYDRNEIVEPRGDIQHRLVGVAIVDVKRNLQRYDLCDDCLAQVLNWIDNPRAFLCGGCDSEEESDSEE